MTKFKKLTKIDFQYIKGNLLVAELLSVILVFKTKLLNLF